MCSLLFGIAAAQYAIPSFATGARTIFKPIWTYHFSLRALDTTALSDWVLWNKKGDKAVEW
jgi:hypothetical protein